MKVDDAPTGFMVIKRSVFEKMMAAYPELNYISDSDYKREDKGLHYRFFDCMVDPESKRYLSEDYTFCRLWQQIGGEVYVRRPIQPDPPRRENLPRRVCRLTANQYRTSRVRPRRHTDEPRPRRPARIQPARRRIA